MCGIVGILPRDGQARPDRALLRRMVRTLAPRGPDAERIGVGAGIGLAVCRLAITELQAGQQPGSFERGALRAALNGQIYNYLELRERLEKQGQRFAAGAEVEVLARGFRALGADLPQHLDGMYSLAAWDGARGRLLLARDPAGQKPLYYCEQPEALLFASEPKALLAHPAVSREIDPTALGQYLMHDFVPAPRTIFAGIRKLQPGETRVYQGARPVHSTIQVPGAAFPRQAASYQRPAAGYQLPAVSSQSPATSCQQPVDWKLETGSRSLAASSRRSRALAAELLDLLDRAVQKRIPAEVPHCAQLSGGLDSSLVAALLARASERRIDTFTIGFDEPSYDESEPARQVAGRIGARHHEIRLTPDRLPALLPEVFDALDEPLADPSAVPTFLLARSMRAAGFPVALAGDGGDELWAGYETFPVERPARWLARLPAPLRRALASAAEQVPVPEGNLPLSMLAARFVSGLSYPPARRHQVWLSSLAPDLLRQVLASGAPRDLFEATDRAWAQSRGLPRLERLLALYFRLYLGDGVLAKADRMSMVHAVEVRAPFLDRALIAFSRSVDAGHKVRFPNRTKVLLKQAALEVLPAAIVHRPKKGFGVPVAAWLRGPLAGEARHLLDPQRLTRQGIFRAAAVQDLLEAHQRGRRDHRKALWALLAFQWWHERWA